VYCLDVKVFNTLPVDMKITFDNPKKFKVGLQKKVLLLEGIFRTSKKINIHI